MKKNVGLTEVALYNAPDKKRYNKLRFTFNYFDDEEVIYKRALIFSYIASLFNY